MEIADLLSVSNPLFRYGMPHDRPRYVPIRTNAHFIMFDLKTVGPRYTMHRISAGTSDKLVGRDDDFISEFTLDERYRTTSEHYANWNRLNPTDVMDRGHQSGSQMRRGDALVQHDVDSLAGCCPESPTLNRVIKNQLECAIVERAVEYVEVYQAAGPLWYGNTPRGWLDSQQWIPDALWMSTLWRPGNTRIECHSWIMDNAQTLEGVNFRSVSLNLLEQYTGLVLWNNVRDQQFVSRRGRESNSEWWLPK